MNLYCACFRLSPSARRCCRAGHPARGAHCRNVAAVRVVAGGALLGKDSFIANYTNFILLLLYVLVPWTAINLVDYYLLRHGHYDVDAFFRHDGGIYDASTPWRCAATCWESWYSCPSSTTGSTRADRQSARWRRSLLDRRPGDHIPAYYWLAKRARRAMTRVPARSIGSAPEGLQPRVWLYRPSTRR